MSKLKLIAVHFIIFLALLLVPYKAYQQATGSITGKVHVTGGGPLAGVTIKAIRNGSNEAKTAITNDSGSYEITGLSEGVYTLNFTKDKFQRSQMRGVKVFANENTVCNLLEMIWESISVNAGDGSGIQLMQAARVGQGGAEYAGLQYLTIRGRGFVNAALFARSGTGKGTTGVTGQVEVRVNITDYQDQEVRRRLEVSPVGGAMGQTFLVYTGTEGGGMFLGNVFRASEVVASRQWAMMGFATLNHAADGNVAAERQRDEMYKGQPHYVVDVKFNQNDTITFWINKRTLLTSRVMTRYRGREVIEEERSDYHKVSCMMLPFRIVTKLNGQRLADLTIDSYDIQTIVPSARFTMTATGK